MTFRRRPRPSLASDDELIEQLLGGSDSAASTIHAWIRGALRGYRSRLGDECEDLEQEALLGVLQNLRQGRFDGRSSLRSYVWSSAVHGAIDRLRRARRWATTELEEGALVEPGRVATDRLEARDARRLAARVVVALNPECRVLWKMIFEGRSYAEMAAELGIREGTLRVRISRCRKRAIELRAKLELEDS